MRSRVSLLSVELEARSAPSAVAAREEAAAEIERITSELNEAEQVSRRVVIYLFSLISVVSSHGQLAFRLISGGYLTLPFTVAAPRQEEAQLSEAVATARIALNRVQADVGEAALCHS